jgi:tetratricopeptide (TPR) repeat protein
MGATMRPGTTRLGQASSPTVVRPYTPAARPAPAPSGSPMLYVVLGVLGTALLVAVAFIYINRSASTTASPPPTVASLPPVTAPPATMAATPAPTTAPTTYVETVGRGAAAMKLAKASFDRQDYEAAISQAQQALQEDPGNTQAKRMVENALNGQKAEARLRAAQAAFGQGRLDEAMNEAEAGRNLAAWDPRFTNLMQRIRDQQQSAHREQAQAAQAAAAVQQQREQQQRMALTNQVNTLLGQADNLLASQQYDAAIKVYDEVLKVDPSNIRAGQGRTGAITARAVTQAGGGARPGGKAFVAGKTSAQSVETRAGGSVPEGFEDTAGVVVKKGSQAADLPGRILFDVDPESPKPGDKYRIRIILSNEGSAPIGIRSLTTTAVVNGRRAAGPVPALVASVAPQQRATLYEVSGEVWREDITSWSFEAVVTTSRNETYKNQITWR